mmetsp:Transcript_29804/g.85316  ORF Transcript_29804/g.85316 Transcript_29804/m.85316 type:complete len:115 (-) Transcript_29804:12-356(-)
MSTAALKELIVRYGKVALGVHFSISTVSLVTCYTAVRKELPVDRLLQQVGLDGFVKLQDAEAVELTDTGARAAQGGAVVAAFILHKALFPLRVPITVAVTPVVYRLLRSASLLR